MTATLKDIELLLDEADIPHYLQDDLSQPAPSTGSSSRDNGDVEVALDAGSATVLQSPKRRLNPRERAQIKRTRQVLEGVGE